MLQANRPKGCPRFGLCLDPYTMNLASVEYIYMNRDST